MNFNTLNKNLDTLLKIKEGQKLIIKDDVFFIDNAYKMRPILRYFTGQSRELAYANMINLINKTSEELDKYNYYLFGASKLKMDEIGIKDDKQYSIMYKKMIDLNDSIDILSITYKNDKEYTRKLVLLKNLISELDPRIKKYTITDSSF